MQFTRRHAALTLLAGPALIAAPALAEPVRLRELYNLDQSFSEFAESQRGNRIEVRGFMAPPLKADAKFFVLTKMPMATCPFCETEAEWPEDILAVYTKRRLRAIPFNVPIEVQGILELGAYMDPDLGFLSMVRLADATYGTR